MLRKLALTLLLVSPLTPARADEPPYQRSEDVIYARRDGAALTLDVFRPRKPNGLGVIQVISGGYFSSREMIQPGLFRALIERGYTVFAVVPGSQPLYQVPDIEKNLFRAVRFVRHNAKRFEIDPDRLGITGSSAGGNLSLLVATAGDAGDPKARDPIDREPSRVQAAAVFFPLTDFLNWGKPGEEHLGVQGAPTPFKAAFDHREMNRETGMMERITDPDKLRAITKAISPIYAVTRDDPPMLVFHGDKDSLVPIHQSQAFVAAAQAMRIPSDLVVKPGANHGWPGMDRDVEKFADWFDTHLRKR